MTIELTMNALVNAGIMTQKQADDAIAWANDEKVLEDIATAKSDGLADPTYFASIEAEINGRRNP